MDAVENAFRAACVNANCTMSSKEEWENFVEILRMDGVPETDTLRKLWTLVSIDGNKTTWSIVQRYLVELFLKKSSSNGCKAISCVEAASQQLQTLCAQIPDKENPKTLLKLLDVCEQNNKILQRCEIELESTCKKVAMGLEIQRLQSLVQHLATDQNLDPHIWHREQVLHVEQRAAARRVLSHNHVRYSQKNQDNEDPWLLTQMRVGITKVRQAQVVSADGKQRAAYVVELAPPESNRNKKAIRLTNQARTLAWRCYQAHRSLSAVPDGKGVLQVLGWFQDDPSPKKNHQITRLLFECPMVSKPLRAELMHHKTNEKLLEPNSPLIRYWLHEILSRFAEIDTMGTHSLLDSLTAQNLWISDHGACIRLGGLRWGPELPHDTSAKFLALHQRRSYLLASFANIADEIIATLCSSTLNNTTKLQRSFREIDIKQGPIRVYTGQIFDILFSPPTAQSRWVFHETNNQCITAHGGAAEWDNRLHFSALRPGKVSTILSCQTQAGNVVATLNLNVIVVAPQTPGQLRSILRCCRSFGDFHYDQLSAEHIPHLPILTPAALLSSHAYFQPLSKKELLDAMDSYEGLFSPPLASPIPKSETRNENK